MLTEERKEGTKARLVTLKSTTSFLYFAFKSTGMKFTELFIPTVFAVLASGFEGVSLALLVPTIRLILGGEPLLPVEFGDLLNSIGLNLPEQPKTILGIFLLATITASIFKVTFSYISSKETSRCVKKFSHQLRVFLFKKYITFDKSYFDNKSLGHHQQILLAYVNGISVSLTALQGLLYASCTILIYAWMLFRISTPLALLSIFFFPLVYILSKQIISKIIYISTEYAKDTNEIGRKIVNTLSFIPLIKSYNRERVEIQQFSHLSQKIADSEFNMEKKSLMIPAIQESLLVVFMLFMFLGINIVEGQAAAARIPQYMVFLMILRRSTALVGMFNTLLSSLASMSGPVEYMRELFLIKSDNNESKFKSYLENDSKESKNIIIFDKINYSYTKSVPAVKDLSFKIPNKKITAIVGPSGSGKSTVLSLILGFCNPDSGSIYVESSDIPYSDLESWRKRISYVSQDVGIFHGTVKENLLYGLENIPSDEELLSVINTAGLTDLYKKLDRGLDTYVGERGAELSGGERQRLSIARALLKKSEILIFDEPTSALDYTTEFEIIANILPKLENKTVVIVTHSIEAVKNADWIIVLNNGNLVIEGQYSELTNPTNPHHNKLLFKNWGKEFTV